MFQINSLISKIIILEFLFYFTNCAITIPAMKLKQIQLPLNYIQKEDTQLETAYMQSLNIYQIITEYKEQGIYMNVLNFILRTYKNMIYPKPHLIYYYKYIADKLKCPVEFIIAHAQIESNQNYLAVGKLGEYGLWQFLPSTWKALMGDLNWKIIENQCQAYILHSNYLIKRYNLNLNSENDQKIFLWCWNAGAGNYDKKIMPSITKNYIEKVLKTTRQVFV